MLRGQGAALSEGSSDTDITALPSMRALVDSSVWLAALWQH